MSCRALVTPVIILVNVALFSLKKPSYVQDCSTSSVTNALKTISSARRKPVHTGSSQAALRLDDTNKLAAVVVVLVHSFFTVNKIVPNAGVLAVEQVQP